MEYDPIKTRLAALLGGRRWLRRLFFLALDLLFLRAWYVRRELRRIAGESRGEVHTILDAGMGFGQYSDRMARLFHGARVIGLEIDAAHFYGGADYFSAVHPGCGIVLGDVQELPFGGERFDLVLTVDVMEHIPDDRAAFAEYARVLKPGGRLVMHTPRIRDDAPDDDEPDVTPQRWHVDEHVRDGYRDEESRAVIGEAGLRVERLVRGYAGAGMVGWTLLQRVPLSLLERSRLLLAPLVFLYILAVLPAALLFMWLDYQRGDHPQGGALLVVARKEEQSD